MRFWYASTSRGDAPLEYDTRLVRAQASIRKGWCGVGSGTQKFAYQKWPDKIFPIVNLVFSPTMVPLVLGGAQSSFKLQQFLCSKGYAMDNLDEPQGIHLSLKLHPYLQSNSSVRACQIDDFCSASSACMQHTVCPTIHCYCNQALLRLSVAVVVLCCSPLCVNVFDCCCCVVMPW